jgi:hypothetical protein
MRERTPISELILQGSPNLKRALSRPPEKRTALGKRAELEAMWKDLVERRDEALADIRENGLVISQDHFHREKLYLIKVPNPALKILQATERQLVQLARLLTEATEAPGGKKSAEQLLRETEEMLGNAN